MPRAGGAYAGDGGFAAQRPACARPLLSAQHWPGHWSGPSHRRQSLYDVLSILHFQTRGSVQSGSRRSGSLHARSDAAQLFAMQPQQHVCGTRPVWTACSRLHAQGGSIIQQLRKDTGASIKVQEHMVQVYSKAGAQPRAEEMRAVSIRANQCRYGFPVQPTEHLC